MKRRLTWDEEYQIVKESGIVKQQADQRACREQGIKYIPIGTRIKTRHTLPMKVESYDDHGRCMFCRAEDNPKEGIYFTWQPMGRQWVIQHCSAETDQDYLILA